MIFSYRHTTIKSKNMVFHNFTYVLWFKWNIVSDVLTVSAFKSKRFTSRQEPHSIINLSSFFQSNKCCKRNSSICYNFSFSINLFVIQNIYFSSLIKEHLRKMSKILRCLLNWLQRKNETCSNISFTLIFVHSKNIVALLLDRIISVQ